MKSSRNINLLMAVTFGPALAGLVALGCGDDGDDPAPMTNGGKGGSAPGGGAGSGGAPAGCMPETSVTADVAADTTWSCPRYVLTKKIYVVNNAKLTIAAGTQIVGDVNGVDKAALLVSRGAQLIAQGTKERPIVFTSSGAAGDRRGGDWAGVALLGSARLNTGMPCASGAAGCIESGVEGIPATETRAKFGGADDTGSCGTLEYVRIEFAGAELEPGKELNGLTVAGCGSGTKLSYVQVHRGTDDGIEFFGGTASMDHVVLSGNEDDSLDWDYGWTGKAQFLVIHQRGASGDWGIEGAGSPQSETALPRTAPMIYNATMIGRGEGGKGVVFKEGSRGILRNLILQNWRADVIDFAAKVVDLTMEWPMQLSVENSLFWMNGNYGAEVAGMPSDDDKGFDDKGSVEAAERNNKLDVDPMLTGVNDLLGGTAPNYVPKNAAVGTDAAVPPAGMDASATYFGAFRPNDTAPWTDGWTAYPAN